MRRRGESTPPGDWRRRGSAYHEAGHAVVAYVVRYGLGQISIDPWGRVNERGAGPNLNTPEYSTGGIIRPLMQWANHAEAPAPTHAAVLLAGLCAEDLASELLGMDSDPWS